ncbi:MAG TPA: hypothetical protein VFW40_00945 [Capsulimonadaceae bacterium]|nr:hypothetical protein [Capsulimonadaceae bacterium]
MPADISYTDDGYEGLTQLLLWAPDEFEESLGYDQGLRFVGFFWDAEWNDLGLNDGWKQSVGAQWRSSDAAEWGVWDDWRGQQMVHNILAAYNLGDQGAPAKDWLILDRQSRQFYVAPAERAALFLRQANPRPSEEVVVTAPAQTAASPYPSEPLPKRKWDEYTI